MNQPGFHDVSCFMYSPTARRRRGTIALSTGWFGMRPLVPVALHNAGRRNIDLTDVLRDAKSSQNRRPTIINHQ